MSKFTDSIDANLGEEYSSISPGSIPDNCIACEDCDPENEEPVFSSRPCETCGSNLAGDRHNAHAIGYHGEIVHFDICTDCVMYFANAEEPENWEG